MNMFLLIVIKRWYDSRRATGIQPGTKMHRSISESVSQLSLPKLIDKDVETRDSE